MIEFGRCELPWCRNRGGNCLPCSRCKGHHLLCDRCCVLQGYRGLLTHDVERDPYAFESELLSCPYPLMPSGPLVRKGWGKVKVLKSTIWTDFFWIPQQERSDAALALQHRWIDQLEVRWVLLCEGLSIELDSEELPHQLWIAVNLVTGMVPSPRVGEE